MCRRRAFTLGAGNHRTALVGLLLDGAVLTDCLGEGTHPQVAHEHTVVAGAVQAGFIRYYPVAFFVVQEIVVASGL